MRTAILTLLILGLASTTAIARKGPVEKTGTIHVTNTCDEAVEVNWGIFGTTLEPNSSRNLAIFMRKGKVQVFVVAKLVSDRSVSASTVCTVFSNKTTEAAVTCSVTPTGVSLEIACDGQKK